MSLTRADGHVIVNCSRKQSRTLKEAVMRLRYVCLAAALVLLFSALLVAQTTSNSQSAASPQATKPEVRKVPVSYTDPSSGKGMYMAYCASCHGADGKGDGPAASALKTFPTNLTQIAIKNGGTFPDAHIMQIIKGDSMTAAHGNKDMPVWGPVFMQMGQQDTAQVQLRIRNLTKYLESIQQK
jgi:mono/diheme cytochrome c family protein